MVCITSGINQITEKTLCVSLLCRNKLLPFRADVFFSLFLLTFKSAKIILFFFQYKKMILKMIWFWFGKVKVLSYCSHCLSSIVRRNEPNYVFTAE